MMKELLKAADKYTEGLVKVTKRRTQWMESSKKLADRLHEIANYLNENTSYKQPFYVDKLHAFNEEINGSCKDMPSITFRSGDMPMMVSFKNAAGDHIDYMEDGFKITFSPTITGQILVLFLPHFSSLDENPPEFKTMAVINDPGQITNDIIDQVILKGLGFAFESSFTGLAEITLEDDDQSQRNSSPIGFKRYDTTEKTNLLVKDSLDQ